MLITTDRREGLRPFVGQRITVIGRVVRYAKYKVPDRLNEPTIYIEDIHLARQPERRWLCEHAWLDGAAFIAAGVGKGDYVKFTTIPHRKRRRYYMTWAWRVRVCRNEI
jgi:hypothetical protein